MRCREERKKERKGNGETEAQNSEIATERDDKRIQSEQKEKESKRRREPEGREERERTIRKKERGRRK